MPSPPPFPPRHPLGALVLVVATLGCARAQRPGEQPRGAAAAEPAAHGAPVRPADAELRSSSWLSLLPDGEEKRRFVLDCTGCHQFDARTARPGGAVRSEVDWGTAIARMLRYAGPRTGFPVISAHVDSARTASWLARSLADRAPSPEHLPERLVEEVEVAEFDMPSPRDLPHDVAVQRDGRVVVTGMFSHAMHVLDPASGAIETVAIPVPNANPRALEIDSLGRWWVVLGAPRMLASRDPATGEWRTFDVGVYPHSLAVGAGRVWYNGHFTHAPELIGSVDAESGSVTPVEMPAHPTLGAGPGGPIPYEIRVAPDGRVWMDELQGNRLLGHDPATGRTSVYEMPLAWSGPRRFDIDRGGRLWIPAYAANALVRLDPATGRFTVHELPVRDALPYVVRIDHRSGAIWVGTSAADALFRFDPAASRWRIHPLPSRGALVRHIAVDPRTGDVWLAYGASPGTLPARVARVRPRDIGR
jgi:virginiamycin B lyase